MRKLRNVLLMLGVPLVAACEDPLNVVNPNNPDRDRVLATPADLEQFIVNSWVTYNQSTLGAPPANQRPGGVNDGLQTQMRVAALENWAELANFGMNIRGVMPRSFIDNQRGNPAETGNYKDFLVLSRAARSAALGLSRLSTPGFSIGTPARDVRARMFAHFVLGTSLATLALTYDSAAIISPADDPEGAPALASYQALSAAGLAGLDSAITLAQANATAFPLPANWVNAGAAVSQGDFVRIARSYRAVLRAGVARNSTERAALDWAAVIADAENGIAADLNLSMSPASGWDVAWIAQHFTPGAWHSMHQFMIGFADTSGAFDAWLATPRASKVPFVIQTPDRRFPVGATRDAQQVRDANGNIVTNPILPAGQYFRNRPPGNDPSQTDGLGKSQYDHYRWRAFFNATRIGPYPVITKAEVDLLAAEGYIRQGNFSAASAKINVTRTRAGLPALSGITSLTDVVPGGVGCVPRVPLGSAFTSTACGNILEAMKWEKRMETAYTGYGNWFFDSRGWGDLPEGTTLHWPVPWQEMDTRRQSFYSLGGCGSSAGAAANTYGISCSL